MGNCKSKKEKEKVKEDNIGKLITLNMLEPINEYIEINDNESINSLIIKSLKKIGEIYYYDVKLYFSNIEQNHKSIIRDTGLYDGASYIIEYNTRKDYIEKYIKYSKNIQKEETCNGFLNLLILLYIYSFI